MAKIKYGIYPNPQPDAEGRTTYQVRHEPEGTMDTRAFLQHLDYHNTFSSTQMMSALTTLKEEIIEQLRNNKRFHINGLGTFQMKVGLKTKTDEEGNPQKPHVTDPQQVTARNVEVTGVSFVPDKTFVRELRNATSTEKATATGVVGRSTGYTRQEVVNALNAYLSENGFITRRAFRSLLGLSNYAAQKWLDELCAEEFPKYTARKEGTTIIYRRFGKG